MTAPFTIQLASVPDRELLVAEIWLGDTQVAEVSQESNAPVVEIFPHPRGGAWILPLVPFLSAVQEAAERLFDSGLAQ